MIADDDKLPTKAETPEPPKTPDTTPRNQRKRPLRSLTLSPEGWERLDEFARRWGLSRSGAVERLVREAPLPRELR
jgi:hypothetical protein